MVWVHVENFWYDGEGRLVRRQGLAGEIYRFEYDGEMRENGVSLLIEKCSRVGVPRDVCS